MGDPKPPASSTSHCLPTLARRDNIEDLTAGYGFVIVDECHHVAASAFFHVLNRIPARYWLGLTATPERRDGLEDLIYHQLGSHHVTLEGPAAGQLPSADTDLLAPHPVLHLHPTQFRYTGDADPSAPGGMAEIYRALIADEARLDQIIADVLDRSHRRRQHPRPDHLDRPPQRDHRTTPRRRQVRHRTERPD